ncbi:MAG: D-alanyl-D-alanine carboxypeptidase/D-alanyl-D-alanine-endopeptidase [Candidatus Cryptobacteroides sp.]
MRRIKSIMNRLVAMVLVALTALQPGYSYAQAPQAPQLPQAALRQEDGPRTRAQEYIELAAQNEILKGSQFSVLAVTVGGDTLALRNPDTRMLPASNMKLITTGAALHALGADFRYSTRLGYSGEIKDGVLDGDLYIIGGGDPTIASKDSMAVPRFFLFSQWAGMLEKAGIREISGRLIGDGRYFDGPIEKDSWAYHDIGCSDACGSDGLCFYENIQEVKVSAGASEGAPVSAVPVFPTTPWMRYGVYARTGKAGTGDNLYYFPTEYVPYGEIIGSYAIDLKPRTETFSNKFGAYTCAYQFFNYLKTKGIEVRGGVADVRMGRIRTNLDSQEYGAYATKVDDLKVIGSTQSPTLKEIARMTNLKSDNFYAETLLRTLGRKMHHSATYDSSYVALGDVMRSLGVDASGVQIRDGSGLSRHNYLSPSFIVSFLKAMMDSPAFGDYIGAIGVAGGSHYESRLPAESPELRKRIHLKSGSMNGVRCYSGYIEPREGTKEDVIVFSIMTNNALVRASQVDPILDRIMAFLATEN